MTGAPSKLFDSRDHTADEIWELLIEAERKKHLLTGACFAGYYGLVGGHAYTVLGTKVVIDDSGRQVKLVEIRNPWAREMYMGPYSDMDH